MAWSTLVRRTLRRIRAQNLTLNGRASPSSLRSLSSHSGLSDETISSDSPNIRYVRDDLLDYADHTARFVQHALRCENHTGIVYKCLRMICYHSVFDTCSDDTKLKVLSAAFDQIRKYPQADPREIFLMEIYIKSMLTDDSKKDITKAEVASRVLNVIQRYPKVSHNKVTEETRFEDDLMFDELDYDLMWKALYLEFKMPLRVEDDVKYTIDYIYDNLNKREDFEKFREENRVGVLFWPMFH